MRNIKDAIDSYLYGKAKVEKWRREFDRKWNEPMAKMLVQQSIEAARYSPMIDRQKLESRLSPEARQLLRGE